MSGITVGTVAAVIDCEHRTAPRTDRHVYGFSIGTRDVRNGRISLERAKPVSRATYEGWTRRAEPQPGDLIFSREAPIGEVGEVPESARVCLGQRTVLLQLDRGRIEPKFLKYSLMAPASYSWIQSNAAGSTVLHLNVADVRKIPVAWLPALEKQRNIVKIVEDHLSRLDAAERELNNARRQIDSFLKARLWQVTHTGATVRPLSEIAEVKLGRQRSPKNHQGNQMTPYLRAANVDWDCLRLDDVKQMNFTDGERDSFMLAPGDILLTEASGSAGEVGKSALYTGEPKEVCFQNTLLRARTREVQPEFLQKYLLAEALAGRFMAHARGVGIHHLGRSRLARWPVGVPGEEQQLRAAREASDAIDEASALKQNLSRTASQGQALRRSLLTAAFSGRLSGIESNRFDAVEMITA